MVSINHALQQVQSEIAQLLTPESIWDVCREHHYDRRERQIDPVTTIHLFIQQVLHGNTACHHLTHISGQRVNGSAYCQARQRLPLDVLQAVVKSVADLCDQAAQEAELFHGHRVWLP